MELRKAISVMKEHLSQLRYILITLQLHPQVVHGVKFKLLWLFKVPSSDMYICTTPERKQHLYSGVSSDCHQITQRLHPIRQRVSQSKITHLALKFCQIRHKCSSFLSVAFLDHTSPSYRFALPYWPVALCPHYFMRQSETVIIKYWMQISPFRITGQVSVFYNSQ